MAQRKIMFVGQFPGPVTGQTVATQHLFQRLEAAAPGVARKCNIVRGDTGSRIVNTAIKGWRALATCLTLLLRSRRNTAVYISVDGNLGMAASLLYATSARLGGAAQIILHHHSRNHIDKKRRLMTALAAASGPAAAHVCICPSMSANLAKQYPSVQRSLSLSNIFILNAQQDAGANDVTPLPSRWRLGHISKLSHAKGLERTIQSLDALHAAGINAELTLAGPFASEEEQRFATTAKSRLGDALTVEGPLYGPEKEAWFQSLDLFLFPSLYRNETQGIVNLEALAAGVPVIAYDGHCIADDLAGLEGWSVSHTDPFDAAVVKFVQKTNENPERFQAERQRAHKRFQSLRLKSNAEIELLFGLCLGEKQ